MDLQRIRRRDQIAKGQELPLADRTVHTLPFSVHGDRVLFFKLQILLLK
jgi:hypothetical protein